MVGKPRLTFLESIAIKERGELAQQESTVEKTFPKGKLEDMDSFTEKNKTLRARPREVQEANVGQLAEL